MAISGVISGVWLSGISVFHCRSNTAKGRQTVHTSRLLHRLQTRDGRCRSKSARFYILLTCPNSLGAQTRTTNVEVFALQSPKGFGPPTPKKKQIISPKKIEANREDEVDEIDDTVPEVVTNRMLRRIGVSVGIPLVTGILFFPFYYYLKAVLKLDIPEWLPLTSSAMMFGTAGLGITYGVVSTSWDPLREGSFLGWKEAQANWPVLWETVQSKKGKK